MTTTLVEHRAVRATTPNGGRLSVEERARLERLEEVIDRGMAVYVQVGLALEQIHSGRLYRGTHANWCDYLRDRWELSYRHAKRQMLAATVVKVLPVGERPALEVHARELLPLRSNPEHVVEAWHAAVEASGGRLTAHVVRAAVTRVQEAHGERPTTTSVRQGTAVCSGYYARRRVMRWPAVISRGIAEYAVGDVVKVLRAEDVATIRAAAEEFLAWSYSLAGGAEHAPAEEACPHPDNVIDAPTGAQCTPAT
jgi:hypothetical protein